MNVAKGKIEAPTVKKWIQAEGIDLIRIADAQNLILAYPPWRATALMPSARSVIVMAVTHSLGAVYSPDIMLWTRNRIRPKLLPPQKSGGTGEEIIPLTGRVIPRGKRRMVDTLASNFEAVKISRNIEAW